ncbi:HAD hydrolase-like protein [Salinirubrum litoreum]|uniref:HAD hydrolase-like protein n=3 Tax=Salinirubrum litoreum TaxID=1126234 RepID=A0ABD5RBH8_9EURY
MTTVLVTTGITDRQRLERSDVTPDFVIDSLAELDGIL